ncbi:MAG: hypothetical protein AAGJ34_10400 [Pseudomonadota bacterium]
MNFLALTNLCTTLIGLITAGSALAGNFVVTNAADADGVDIIN